MNLRSFTLSEVPDRTALEVVLTMQTGEVVPLRLTVAQAFLLSGQLESGAQEINERGRNPEDLTAVAGPEAGA